MYALSSSDGLWFVWVGLASVKFEWTVESKLRKLCCRHAILFKLSLGILILDPCFFFHHFQQHSVPQGSPCIWHFENSRALLWNLRYSEKGDTPWLSTCCLQFRAGKRFHGKVPTNLKVLPILPTANLSLCALPMSIARSFFEGSNWIFCVWIRPHQ